MSQRILGHDELLEKPALLKSGDAIKNSVGSGTARKNVMYEPPLLVQRFVRASWQCQKVLWVAPSTLSSLKPSRAIFETDPPNTSSQSCAVARGTG